MKPKNLTKKPVPDVKAATREILCRVAAWMETRPAEFILYADKRYSEEEWAALEEARALAVAYVRLGVRL